MPGSRDTEARRAARTLFRKLDKNFDNSLSKEEVVAGLEDLGAGDLGTWIFELLDANTDGKVTTKEFVDGFQLWQQGVLKGTASKSDQGRRSKLTDYKEGKQIGFGTTGSVFEVTRVSDKTVHAAKKVYKNALRTTEAKEQFRREIKLHSGLNHNSIVNLSDVVETPDECHLVMERCHGDLIEVLSDHEYGEKHIARLVGGIMEGLEYLHSNEICHHNLKPENIMMTSTDLDAANVKIIDFSSASALRHGRKVNGYTGKTFGSPAFTPPEVLEGHPAGFEADIWSAGVIMYFVLSGKMPFDNASLVDLSHSVVNEQPEFDMAFADVSEDAVFLIKSMLSKDPSKRPTARDFLASKWMERAAGVSEDAVLQSFVAASANVKKYRGLNVVKKRMNLLCAELMEPKEVLELTAAFEDMDIKGTGNVSIENMFVLLSQSNKMRDHAEEVLELVGSMDLDGDGYIGYREFLAASAKAGVLRNEARLKQVFDKLDKDGSGAITVDELQGMLVDISEKKTELGTEENNMAKLLLSWDRNKDGTIDFDEFMDEMKADNDALLENARCLSMEVVRAKSHFERSEPQD